MSSNQIIILSVFLGYLLFNVVVSFAYSKKAEKSLHTSEENKYFIGGRNMNGIVLAMTIMATYTFRSGSGWTYLWICTGVDRRNSGAGYISGAWRAWK